MKPPSVATPPLVTEIAPAALFFEADVMSDPAPDVNVPPQLIVTAPPCPFPLLFVCALEINAPACAPLVPLIVKRPPTVNVIFPPAPLVVEFSVTTELPVARSTLPLTAKTIGHPAPEQVMEPRTVRSPLTVKTPFTV